VLRPAAPATTGSLVNVNHVGALGGCAQLAFPAGSGRVGSPVDRFGDRAARAAIDGGRAREDETPDPGSEGCFQERGGRIHVGSTKRRLAVDPDVRCVERGQMEHDVDSGHQAMELAGVRNVRLMRCVGTGDKIDADSLHVVWQRPHQGCTNASRAPGDQDPHPCSGSLLRPACLERSSARRQGGYHSREQGEGRVGGLS